MRTREELKQFAREYAKTHRKMGIYQVRNKVTGYQIIGSSMDLEKVWNKESFTLKMNGHVNRGLQKEWNTYGEESFEIEFLELIEPEEEWITSDQERVKYKLMLQKLLETWTERLQETSRED
ncbi:GIY-YIG nuclease family protein [Paenibacillus taiwanensis]|uniref:GIY-YIG nuclease family protein n=1 Tax=Paenibacillus taiwanensis TaxID=401638 RepID=UPI00041ECB5D|nr:GIY-YIG nuclease family protein [Paenibacillus taiwanensis]